jgi:prepilin-type N-terminal cleavage/methylation domain-containing protein
VVRPGVPSNILNNGSLIKESDQGFSLVESLIAIIILGIIMAGGLAFFYYANNLYYRGLHYQMATWIVDSRMEKIKSAGCSGAPSLSHWSTDISPAGTPSFYLNGSTPTASLPNPIAGQRLVTLSCGTLNDAVVKVIWTEPGEPANSNRHSVSVETYVGP